MRSGGGCSDLRSFSLFSSANGFVSLYVGCCVFVFLLERVSFSLPCKPRNIWRFNWDFLILCTVLCLLVIYIFRKTAVIQVSEFILRELELYLKMISFAKYWICNKMISSWWNAFRFYIVSKLLCDLRRSSWISKLMIWFGFIWVRFAREDPWPVISWVTQESIKFTRKLANIYDWWICYGSYRSIRSC